MKWSPKNGNILSLKSFQLESYSINISNGSYILFCTSYDGFAEVKICIVSIESTGSLLASHGTKPMPLKRYNSFSIGRLIPLNSFIDGTIVHWIPSKPWIMWRIILHVKSLNHRGRVDNLFEILVILGSLSRNNVLSIVLLKFFVKIFCLNRRISHN